MDKEIKQTSNISEEDKKTLIEGLKALEGVKKKLQSILQNSSLKT